MAFHPRLLAAIAMLFALGTTHADEAAPKKVLRLSIESAETGFDPAQLSDFYSRSIVREIFEAPLRFAYLARPGTLELATAARLPIASADFRSFVFELKPGIYFQDDPAFDGKPRELVAADYVYSIKRFADPRWKSPGWSTVETWRIVGLHALRDAAIKDGHFDYDHPIAGLQVLDRYRFEVRLEEPSPRLPEDFTDASSVGAVAREVVERYGDGIMAHPVGTGGYRLVEWRRSSRIVLERNPGYRLDVYDAEGDSADADAQRLAAALKGKRLPFIDRVEVDVITEPQPRWLAFLAGSQDILERMPPSLTPLALPNGKPSPTLVKRAVRVEHAPMGDLSLISFNMDDPVVGGYTPERVALRRAIGLGFDAPEVVRSYFKGQAFVAQSPIMPTTRGYDADFRSEMGQLNPARANAMLDVYGYDKRDADGYRLQPDGSPLSLMMNTMPDQAARIIDEVTKKSFDRLHLRIAFSTAPFSENLRKVRNGQYQLFISGGVANAPDSGSTLQRAYSEGIGGPNLSRFRSARYDELYRRQTSLVDGPERTAAIAEMVTILLAYAPIKFTTHRYAIDLSYPNLVGYRHWPFVSDWWRYVDIAPLTN